MTKITFAGESVYASPEDGDAASQLIQLTDVDVDRLRSNIVLVYNQDTGFWEDRPYDPAAMTIAEAPPADPVPGALWLDSRTLALYGWYPGATGGAWIGLSGGGGSGAIVAQSPPRAPREGDFWLDSASLALYVRYGGTWVRAAAGGGGGPGTTPPPPVAISGPDPGARPGDLWLDSSTLRLYVRHEDANSAQWLALGQGGGRAETISDAPPANPEDGDTWFDTSSLRSYRRYQGYWLAAR